MNIEPIRESFEFRIEFAEIIKWYFKDKKTRLFVFNMITDYGFFGIEPDFVTDMFDENTIKALKIFFIFIKCEIDNQNDEGEYLSDE